VTVDWQCCPSCFFTSKLF